MLSWPPLATDAGQLTLHVPASDKKAANCPVHYDTSVKTAFDYIEIEDISIQAQYPMRISKHAIF